MIDAFLYNVTHKTITGALALYLINRLLVLQLFYVSQIMILSEADWYKLYKPVLKFIKRKLELAINFPTHTLFHDNIIGVADIWKEYCTYLSMAFTARINTQKYRTASLHKYSTLIRIRTFQLSVRISLPIWNSVNRHETPNSLT